MSHAVYLVSSFPMLCFGDVPPFTVADLRKKCEGMLTEKELDNLDALIEGRDCDDPFVAAFQAHEIQMKNVSGRSRANAWGPEARFSERSFPGYDATFAKMIADAFSKTNPLEKEQDIDRARFWVVDEIAGVGETTMAHVYAFAVKLMICERWARMTEEAGDAAVLKAINDNDPAMAQG